MGLCCLLHGCVHTPHIQQCDVLPLATLFAFFFFLVHTCRCVPDARPSQITLYLEEPSLCSYILTVEASFICDLLQTVDEHGMFRMEKESGDKLQPGASGPTAT